MPEQGPDANKPATVPLGQTVDMSGEELVRAQQLSQSDIDADAAGESTVPASPSDRSRGQLASKRPPAINGYEILRPLGSGAYGEVWQAREEKTGVLVAVKFFGHGAGRHWGAVQEEV